MEYFRGFVLCNFVTLSVGNTGYFKAALWVKAQVDCNRKQILSVFKYLLCKMDVSMDLSKMKVSCNYL